MKYIEHKLSNNKTIKEAIVNKGSLEIDDSNLEYDIEIKQLKTINTKWNENNFNKINLPIEVLKLDEKEIDIIKHKKDMRILDMPIKFPGSNYRIPKEIEFLEEIIKQVAYYEKKINKNLENYYCYLTIDRKEIKKNQNTRKGGLHVDGFQGDRIKKKLEIDHSYIIHTNNGTIFYEQEFKVEESWDKKCHNYFEGFEKQKIKEKERIYEDNTILLIDAYCLHEAPIVKEDTYRTFIRLSYTVREFDRLGNAHNPMFEYKWDMIERNTQASLICPI